MAHMTASEIRELLKITSRPEVISFAGGLPAPELFPLEAIRRAGERVLEETGARALQYSTTEGVGELREWIAERMNRTLGVRLDADNILITNGSQQALDLSGKVFLDEGDVVLCESPTYLAAISAFRAYGCAFVEIPTDAEGMDLDALEDALRGCGRAKLIYMIPNFQNPSGHSWSLERRRGLARLAGEYGLAVVEDNPYGELRFAGEFLPSVMAFDRSGCVLTTGTFSKTLCPGLRIAWIAGDKELIARYVLAKQGADLHSGTYAQHLILKYLELFDIDAHIAALREVYGRRCALMLEALDRELPAGTAYTRPEGGLFIWLELPRRINARTLLERCLEKNLAFVPGGAFFPNGGRENTLRMNFSNMPEERIVEGVRRLGRTLREMA
jgi:2-aminoadipate transaminase